MSRFLLRLGINAVALWVAVSLVPGMHWNGSSLALIAVALVFGIVNALVKPLLTALTCPLILLTLGLFLLVVNALLLLLTASLSQALGFSFVIDGFWSAFWGGLLIGITSTILTSLTGAEQRGNRS